MRIMHENPETAGAKMSALCSFCVHHVAVNGEAVNSNPLARVFGEKYLESLDRRKLMRYTMQVFDLHSY